MPIRLLAVLLGALMLAGCSSPRPEELADAPPDPTPAQTVYDILSGADDLSVFATLTDSAGLASTLDTSGPFTVFAPSNEALAALPSGTVEAWLQPERLDELAALVSSHIVPIQLSSRDLRNGQALHRLIGEPLLVRTLNGRLQVSGSTLIATNVDAGNGVVHVIDAVLAD